MTSVSPRTLAAYQRLIARSFPEVLEAPSMTAEDHIASLRDTDPVKWIKLNEDWNKS